MLVVEIAGMKAKTLSNFVQYNTLKYIFFTEGRLITNTEKSNFGKTQVLSPPETNVKMKQIIIRFKCRNMLPNTSE